MSTEVEVIKIATEVSKSYTIEIIGWAISIVSPVILGLVTAVTILWRSRREHRKDLIENIERLRKENQDLQIAIQHQQKEQIVTYYETLKNLTPFLEKSVDIQSRIFNACDELIDLVKNLDNKYQSVNSNIYDIDKNITRVINEIESVLQESSKLYLVTTTKMESLIDAANNLLEKIRDKHE